MNTKDFIILCLVLVVTTLTIKYYKQKKVIKRLEKDRYVLDSIIWTHGPVCTMKYEDWLKAKGNKLE